MVDDKQSEIERLPLFRGCIGDEARRIAKIADRVDVCQGTVLAHEGGSAREFIIVLEGAAALSSGQRRELIGPGAFFGEMQLLGEKPYEFTVSARTPLRLLVFDARAFRGLLDSSPSVARRLLESYVQRVRVAEDQTRRLLSTLRGGGGRATADWLSG